MDYNMQRVGNNIRALRKKARVSANELANHIYISPSYLRLIERGQRGIRIEKLCALCSFFNVPLDVITYKDLSVESNVAREKDEEDIYAQIEELLRGACKEELALALKVIQDIRAATKVSNTAKKDEDIKY